MASFDNGSPDFFKCDILKSCKVRADMVIDGAALWVREVVYAAPTLVMLRY